MTSHLSGAVVIARSSSTLLFAGGILLLSLESAIGIPSPVDTKDLDLLCYTRAAVTEGLLERIQADVRLDRKRGVSLLYAHCSDGVPSGTKSPTRV